MDAEDSFCDVIVHIEFSKFLAHRIKPPYELLLGLKAPF